MHTARPSPFAKRKGDAERSERRGMPENPAIFYVQIRIKRSSTSL